MDKRWLFLLLVAVVVLVVEGESKKIPNPYKVLGVGQNANQE